MDVDALVARLADALDACPEVRFAVLFGSAVARGPDAARDIDLAVSLDRPRSLLELGGLAGRIEDRVGRDIDLVDLDEASTLLRWEVLRTGRVVNHRDADAWHRFQAQVPIEYCDLRPYLDREAEGLRRVLGEASGQPGADLIPGTGPNRV